MYAGDKSCVNSLTTAREIWQDIGADEVGVALMSIMSGLTNV